MCCISFVSFKVEFSHQAPHCDKFPLDAQTAAYRDQQWPLFRCAPPTCNHCALRVIAREQITDNPTANTISKGNV
jgi:hypothetical protein